MKKFEKINTTVVRKFLKKAKLSTDGTATELVTRLEEHESKASKLAECDVCGFMSDFDHECCPFCGSAEVEVELGDEDIEVEQVANIEFVPPKKPAKEKPAKELKAGVTKADPADRKPRAAKELKAPTEDVKPPQQKLVKVQSTGTEVLSEKTLDVEVKAIRKLQTSAMSDLWEVGNRLRVIEERGLFALRRDEDGKPKYKYMTQFCEGELDMNKKYVQKLIDISQRFTREDLAIVGPSKLALLVGVNPGPEADRLLEAAKLGATRETISDEIAKLGADDRTGIRRPGYKGPEKNIGPRKRSDITPAKSDTLTTIVTDPVSHVIFLADGKPTKNIKGSPVATELAANGVVIHYTIIVNDEGHLSLKVERTRPTPAV